MPHPSKQKLAFRKRPAPSHTSDNKHEARDGDEDWKDDGKENVDVEITHIRPFCHQNYPTQIIPD